MSNHNQLVESLYARTESAEARVRELEAQLGAIDGLLMKRFRLGLEPIADVVAFMRANWLNDGAEGESVHKLCLYAETVPKLLHAVGVAESRITNLESQLEAAREELARCRND